MPVRWPGRWTDLLAAGNKAQVAALVHGTAAELAMQEALEVLGGDAAQGGVTAEPSTPSKC
jgi:hypothetical protein